MPDVRIDRPLATEWKVLVPVAEAATIADWASSRLGPDPYAANATGDGYRTTTIYFDTPDGDVFARRGSYGRSKYRVRTYAHAETVFLERKMRTAERLSKRRTAIPAASLDHLAAATPATWPGAWFAERLALRRLAPVCLLRYDRIARVGMGPAGPFRLTIDLGLRGLATTALDLSVRDTALTPVLDDTAVVEMKFVRDVPAVFKSLIETFALRPARFSKYRHARPHLMESPCLTS